MVVDGNVVVVKPESIEVSRTTNCSVSSTIWSLLIRTIPYCLAPSLSPALKITTDPVFEKSSGDSAVPSSVEKLWMENAYYWCTAVYTIFARVTYHRYLLMIFSIMDIFWVSTISNWQFMYYTTNITKQFSSIFILAYAQEFPRGNIN